MEEIRERVEVERAKFAHLKNCSLPVDVLTLAEIDLELDIIPFPDLDAKYRVAAALRKDFTGIYVDEGEYIQLEKGPEWKIKRLRFSVAHELAHYFLHQEIPQIKPIATLHDFATWSETYAGRKYTIEQEANEFAGRLLVPLTKLQSYLDLMSKRFSTVPKTPSLRDVFCNQISDKFLVNAQVIAARLDREGLWASE